MVINYVFFQVYYLKAWLFNIFAPDRINEFILITALYKFKELIDFPPIM